MGEFDLIARYFKRPTQRAVLGVGDDCALLAPTPGMHMATSSDMLVEGRHFLSTVDPARLGHKALAVNLSDLAACGAEPTAFTLALSLPRIDEVWLEGFSTGLLQLANEYGCELVGGDTTQGPLNICITAFGEVPPGDALLRQNAQVGDDIYVSGTVGDARLALEVFRGTQSLDAKAFEAVRTRMEMPTPRIALGIALRAIANAAIEATSCSALKWARKSTPHGFNTAIHSVKMRKRLGSAQFWRNFLGTNVSTSHWLVVTTTNCVSPRLCTSEKWCMLLLGRVILL